MKLFRVLSRFLFLSAAICTQFAAVQAQQTPATFSLVATPDFDGNDGSQEKPFRGAAIELFLDIQDDTVPSSYIWGGYQASRIGGTGTFCPGNFQFFGTEGRFFSLKHPRVASGTILIRVMGFVQEDGFELGTVEGDFYITQHPNGCTGTGGGGGIPVINSFSANNSTNTANTNGTILLSARATDNDSSLTFLFFQTTQIARLDPDGCAAGCTASPAPILAPSFPTTLDFRVEVGDSDGNTASRNITVRIVGQDGGGGNQQCDPGQAVSQTCGGAQVSVNAGCADPVLGGEPVPLNGAVSGGVAGGAVVPLSSAWTVIDTDGLSQSDLVIQNSTSAQATLLTPDVNTDRTITVRLRGTVEGCVAEDTLQITLLADPLPGADISVSLADSPDPVSVGEQVAYTMTVANNGPDAAPNVQAQFSLSGAGTILSATPDQCTAVGSTVSCSFGTLLNGQIRVATIQVRADNAGTLTGSAFSTSGAEETNAANNNASVTTTAVSATADLSILKSGPQGQQPLGAEIEYQLLVTNNGPDEATDVQVTDVLPAEVSTVAVSPVVTTLGSCSVNGQVVTCNLGDMPFQTQAQVTIRVTADASGTFTNRASVSSSSTADGNSDNNSSSVPTEVTDAKADLSINVLVEGPEMGGPGGVGQAALGTFLAQGAGNGVVRVMQGRQVSYVITIANNGPDEATNVVVTDALPEGMDITAAVPDQGSCEIVAGTVSCDLGRLEDGESAVVRIEVLANAEAQVINAVSVQASQIDPDMDDNNAEAEVRIRSLPGLFATTHADNLASLDPQLAGAFVGLALHNPIGDENTINIQGLSEAGEVIADFDQVDPVQPLGQQAVLTRQLVDGDTVLAEGLRGPVQGFFMIGAGDLRFLDGIGNRLEESVCSEENPPLCLTFLPQAREVDDDLTVVFLFNPDLTEAATFTATLFDVNGAQRAEVTDTLEPSGSVLATLRQLFGEEEGVIEDGFIQVQSDRPLRGFEALIEDETLISLPATRGLLSRKLSVPHFAIGRTLSTPIRILNVGAGEVTVNLRATFDDSSEGTREAEFMIPPGQVRTIDLADQLGVDIDSLPTNRLLQGFLELDLAGGILGPFEAVPDVVPTITFDEEVQKTRSSLPMVSGEGAREILFLQVAHTRRPGGTFQGLAIFNPQLEAVQVTVQAYRENGEPRVESVVTIGPRSRVVGLLSEFLGGTFEQTGGYLRLSSDSPVIAYSLFGGPSFLSAIGGQTPLK
ncbi:MAG: DUF11 domain-containing protein [Acidobacteriota bacterium]